MGRAEQLRLTISRPMAHRQRVVKDSAVGFQPHPGQRALWCSPRPGRFHRRSHPRLLVLRHILPNNRMHQHPRCAGRLWAGQFGFDKVRGIHRHQVGRALLGRCNRRLQPLEAEGQFRPNIGFEPHGLRRIGEIDGGDIAALERGEFDCPVRRWGSAPFRGESHCGLLRPHLHTAQIIAIAINHQVDAGA